MNKYIKEQRWIETVRERLNVGLRKYGFQSEFIKQFLSLNTSNKVAVEELFKEYEIYTRSEKLKMIISKMDNDE